MDNLAKYEYFLQWYFVVVQFHCPEPNGYQFSVAILKCASLIENSYLFFFILILQKLGTRGQID